MGSKTSNPWTWINSGSRWSKTPSQENGPSCFSMMRSKRRASILASVGAESSAIFIGWALGDWSSVIRRTDRWFLCQVLFEHRVMALEPLDVSAVLQHHSLEQTQEQRRKSGLGNKRIQRGLFEDRKSVV